MKFGEGEQAGTRRVDLSRVEQTGKIPARYGGRTGRRGEWEERRDADKQRKERGGNAKLKKPG